MSQRCHGRVVELLAPMLTCFQKIFAVHIDSRIIMFYFNQEMQSWLECAAPELDIPQIWEEDKPLSKYISTELPYFFGYKTEFFSFQNNPKDLDPSCKMDLDLWDCLGRVKLVL